MPLPPAGPGAGQDQLADQSGVLDHQRLGDHASEREREDVDRVVPERGDERVRIVGHRFDRAGHFAVEAPSPAVVERDHVVAPGDRSKIPWIPVVKVRGEVDEEDDWNPTLGPSSRLANVTSRGDASCGCVLVRGGRSHVMMRLVAHEASIRCAGR
jgi:hypothetical protein